MLARAIGYWPMPALLEANAVSYHRALAIETIHVVIVMLHNDISHVWHMLVVNLEVNNYNSLDTRIIKCIVELVAFYIKYCQASSTYKDLHDPWSHIIFGL